MARLKNPFLPKIRRPPRRKVIAQPSELAGPTTNIRADANQESAVFPSKDKQREPYRKDTRGRPPKKSSPPPEEKDWHPDRQGMYARGAGWAGRLAEIPSHFMQHMGDGWGSSLDMLALAHGATGCGVHALTRRFHPAGFRQGIESFTALDVGTNLIVDDIEDTGNTKLEKAIDEAHTLFPLARGMVIINEEPIGMLGSNVQGIIRNKVRETGALLMTSSYGWASTVKPAMAAGLKEAARGRAEKAGPYDVALVECGPPGLVWILDRLLQSIGLNPVHATTGASARDLGRISQCRLLIGSTFRPNAPDNFQPGSLTYAFFRLLGIPLVLDCFIGPDATDAALRRIATHFDARIQRRTEQVIATNRMKTQAVLTRYRPRLEGKLFLSTVAVLPKECWEPFRLLGLRLGDPNGWTGKTGVPRTPRVTPKWDDEVSWQAYFEETQADLAYRYGYSEYDWRKRGLAGIPDSPVFDWGLAPFSGYDGFALLAATLDRHINAPWRMLMKPPWPQDSG